MNAWDHTKSHVQTTLPRPASNETAPAPFDADSLRARFDSCGPPLIGIEEELMLVHPRTLDLLPCAPKLLEQVAEDPRFKLELPASQVEIVTPARGTIEELAGELAQARRQLAATLGQQARLLAAGVHPFASGEGELNVHGRYGELAEEYGLVARRQLVCGLHVHVSLAGADRSLAVYNALRSYLPLLAALAANAPIHGGRDTKLASVRPLISGLLPRQGVPPRLDSIEQLCAELAWGARTGRLQGVPGWWWELRIHAELATIEIRVPDTQSTTAETVAVAAVAASLVLWLGKLYDAGALDEPAPGWRIAENRWSATRDGTHGHMYDLISGSARPTRELLHELIEQLGSTASTISATPHLGEAARMLERNGADRQRELHREDRGMLARELTRLVLVDD